jgi:hypothetical protein
LLELDGDQAIEREFELKVALLSPLSHLRRRTLETPSPPDASPRSL